MKKETQGHRKRKRMYADLLRNYSLRRVLKRIRKARRKSINRSDNGISDIVDEFVKLKRKVAKYHKKMGLHYNFAVAEAHAIEGHLIDALIYEREGDRKSADFLKRFHYEMDMCTVFDLYDEEFCGENSDGIITLRPYLIMSRLAYPVAIGIHPGASKNDVLDFVEKRWSEVENNLRRGEPFEKAVRQRKRKHDQKILDFIWENKGFADKYTKELLEKKFPNNGITYYEINKLIHLESERRNF